MSDRDLIERTDPTEGSQPTVSDAAAFTRLLDAIPGAWDGAQAGLDDADAGRVVELAAL